MYEKAKFCNAGNDIGKISLVAGVVNLIKIHFSDCPKSFSTV